MGNGGGDRGFLILPSLEAFEALAEAGPRLPQGPELLGPIDLGTGWLALSYESASALPPGMRREAMAHGWRVAGADAYPRVERRDRDGVLRPLVERDVDLVCRIAVALAAFFLRYGHIFEAEWVEPVRVSQFDEDDVELQLTAPYEAFEDFEDFEGDEDDEDFAELDEDEDFDDLEDPEPAEVAPPPARAQRVGRNDPCPCGRGRKYNKCHLA
jgi:hypothetical protein